MLNFYAFLFLPVLFLFYSLWSKKNMERIGESGYGLP